MQASHHVVILGGEANQAFPKAKNVYAVQSIGLASIRQEKQEHHGVVVLTDDPNATIPSSLEHQTVSLKVDVEFEGKSEFIGVLPILDNIQRTILTIFYVRCNPFMGLVPLGWAALNLQSKNIVEVSNALQLFDPKATPTIPSDKFYVITTYTSGETDIQSMLKALKGFNNGVMQTFALMNVPFETKE